MSSLPSWLPADAVEEQIEMVRDRTASVRTARETYLDRLERNALEAAAKATQEYQVAVYRRRQAEGELLWVALGQAIADIAATVGPEDEAVAERGESFLEWASRAEDPSPGWDRDRILVEIARRSPTLPEAHAVYVESMFDLTRSEIAALRDQDREMLTHAGWQRDGRSGESYSILDCPRCGNDLVIRSPEDADLTIAAEFTGLEGEMREVCPHCGQFVFVVTGIP